MCVRENVCVYKIMFACKNKKSHRFNIISFGNLFKPKCVHERMFYIPCYTHTHIIPTVPRHIFFIAVKPQTFLEYKSVVMYGGPFKWSPL